ncbi:MAG: hypothetical protein IJ153_01530 [Clostridia bacterium]|nr:hypothetical protein [Clostridia bacterium]
MNTIDAISGKLAEMCLIAEGAVSIYENAQETDSDAYSLIGDALYLLREKLFECLTAAQSNGKEV